MEVSKGSIINVPEKTYHKITCIGNEPGIRFAVTAGYLKMRLDTETRLEKAIELYQKFKFVTIEKYNDNPLENIIYMERDLKL